MNCIIAILLYVPSKMQMNRLVFIDNDASNPLYDVFNVPQNGKFPVPENNQHIVMTQTKVDFHGTFINLYCSDMWSGGQIIKNLIPNQYSIAYDSYNSFTTDLSMKNECKLEIDKKYHEIPAGRWNGYWVRWSDLDKTKCSPDTIANLAFDGLFNIRGKYQNFAPIEFSSRSTLDVDESFELGRLVLNGEMYPNNFGSKEEVLVWYQGHLHLFHKVKDSSWFPYTRVSYSNENGPKITSFVLRNYFKDLHLSRYLPYSMRILCQDNRSPHRTSETTSVVELVSLIPNFQAVDLGRLDAKPAYGRISGKKIRENEICRLEKAKHKSDKQYQKEREFKQHYCGG